MRYYSATFYRQLRGPSDLRGNFCLLFTKQCLHTFTPFWLKTVLTQCVRACSDVQARYTLLMVLMNWFKMRIFASPPPPDHWQYMSACQYDQATNIWSRSHRRQPGDPRQGEEGAQT